MKRTLLLLLVLVAVASPSFAQENKEAIRWPFGKTLFSNPLPPEVIHNRRLWMGKITDIIHTLRNAWIAPLSRARKATKKLSREVRKYGSNNAFNRQLARHLNYAQMNMHSDYVTKQEAIQQLRGIRRFIRQSLR